MPTLLMPREVANALRLSVDSIYRMAASGDIGSVRVSRRPGASLRIPASELERILGSEQEEHDAPKEA